MAADLKVLTFARPEPKAPEPAPVTLNHKAIEIVEGLLDRLKSGQSVSAALVEVYADGSVATFYSSGDTYHRLNSGCATLAARIALD